MAVDIDQDRLYCTVAEIHFGPQCANYDEAEQLRFHAYRTLGDPRGHAPGVLADLLAAIRDGSAPGRPTLPALLCLCGSGLRWSSKESKFGTPDKTRCGACDGTEAGR